MLNSAYASRDISDFSPPTTPVITVEEVPQCESSVVGQTYSPSLRTVLQPLLWATLFLAPSSTAIKPPIAEWAQATNASVKLTSEIPNSVGRRISLKEARRIALKAHQAFEDGIRADREQEARLFDFEVLPDSHQA
jgi:hypothetical protein